MTRRERGEKKNSKRRKSLGETIDDATFVFVENRTEESFDHTRGEIVRSAELVEFIGNGIEKGLVLR